MNSIDERIDCETDVITAETLAEERAIFGELFNSPENVHAFENTDIVKRHFPKKSN